MLDFLGEKLLLRHSTNNFRWVGYPPTDNGDFHKTQVIKLQEMKFKKQGKSPSVYLCYSYPSNCKLDLKMIIPAGLQRLCLRAPHCWQRQWRSCTHFPPNTQSSSAGVPGRRQARSCASPPLQSLVSQEGDEQGAVPPLQPCITSTTKH